MTLHLLHDTVMLHKICISAAQIAHVKVQPNVCVLMFVQPYIPEQQQQPTLRAFRAALRDTIRQYYIKVPDAQPIGGLPESKNWVLRGPQNDSLGLHEFLAMDLSRGLDWWAPRTQYTEVWDSHFEPKCMFAGPALQHAVCILYPLQAKLGI